MCVAPTPPTTPTHPLDRPTVDAKVSARIDATSHSRIDLEGRYRVFTDYPGSPNIQADLVRLPIAMTYGATAGVGHRFNRLEVTLKGLLDRTVYNDSRIYGWPEREQCRPQLQPAMAPSCAPATSYPRRQAVCRGRRRSRKYDLPVDAGGANRSSQGRYVKAGTTFELSPTLSERGRLRISVTRLPGSGARGGCRFDR